MTTRKKTQSYVPSAYQTELELQTEQYQAYRIKDIPLSDRPHEKLQNYGPEELTNRELLAAILYTGTKKEGVMEMATRIIDEYGDNYVINETDPKRLAKFLNLPISKATQVVAAFNLGKRLFQERKEQSVTIRNAKDALRYVKDMQHLPKEHLKGLYLNSRFKLVHEETISIGTLTESIVHPREVFRPAIEYGAVAVILVHNHPSGDTTPSQADLELTERIVEAGKLLGIELIDHLVVAGNKSSSISCK